MVALIRGRQLPGPLAIDLFPTKPGRPPIKLLTLSRPLKLAKGSLAIRLVMLQIFSLLTWSRAHMLLASPKFIQSLWIGALSIRTRVSRGAAQPLQVIICPLLANKLSKPLETQTLQQCIRWPLHPPLFNAHIILLVTELVISKSLTEAEVLSRQAREVKLLATGIATLLQAAVGLVSPAPKSVPGGR